jgi:transcriptional regulator with XRE-family HTH domain
MPKKMEIHNTALLGRIIQLHRTVAGLSRIELAQVAGVGKTVIFDIEKGKPTIQLNTLFKLLHALNIALHLDSPLMARFEDSENAKS